MVLRNSLHKISIGDAPAFLREENPKEPFEDDLGYEFTLSDAIEECEEQGIRVEALLREAASVGLLVKAGPLPFEEVLRGTPGNPWETLSADQKEVCELYVAWVFVKKE